MSGPHLPVFAAGSRLKTVTATAGDVAVFPAESKATADNVCGPTATAVVSHEMAYGASVSLAPRSAPSSRNWTAATATSSAAVAVTVTVPDTLAPFAGAVNVTVGAVTSGATVVNEIGTASVPLILV
jgi:hypothetical protein